MRVRSIDSAAKFLTVKRSKTGLGVFANREFKAGRRIIELIGKLITCNADEDLDENTRNNAIRFDKKYYISPNGKVGDYFNHSCDPNSYIVKSLGKLYLVACRDIKDGEEITFDYSTITAPDDIWEMKCHCQNKNCRKSIKSFDKLSKKLRDDYLSRKMIPSYIYRITNK